MTRRRFGTTQRRPSDRSPKAEPEPQPGPDGLTRIATLAAGALGLVGYLYALGGIVVWLRVQTAQLAPDGAIVAANSKHLLAIGVRVVAFELFLLIAVGIIIAAVVGAGIVLRQGLLKGGGEPPQAPESQPKPEESEVADPALRSSKLQHVWNDEGTLGGFIGPELGLLMITFGLSLHGSGCWRTALWISGSLIVIAASLAMIFRPNPVLRRRRPSLWRRCLRWVGEKLKPKGLRVLAIALLAVAFGLGIFVLPLLQGTILLAFTVLIYVGPLVSWPDRDEEDSFGRELLRSGGLWTAIAVFTVIALAWVATPPVFFTRAVVESLHHTTSKHGAYLDRGDGGVYLGTCTEGEDLGHGHETSTESRITLVPGDESIHVRLGQQNYGFDPGGRPSIWQTIKTIVGGGSAGVHNAPLHHPLRGQIKEACGSDHEPRSKPKPIALTSP